MPNYVTTDEFVAWSNVNDGLGGFDTTSFDHVLDAAEEAVEDHCHRVFTDAGSASARVYSAKYHDLVVVDDFNTTVGLIVETDAGGSGTWTASTAYQLEPLNGVVNGRSGWPYTTIRAKSGLSFPVHDEARVRVTARWGWTAVPDQVKASVRMTALRLWRRRKSPEGVLGYEEFGGLRVPRLDPDVERLLAPYVRVWDMV